MSLEDFQDFDCPYCNQPNSLGVDISGGSRQEFVVDCTVCCAPIVVRVILAGDRILSVEVERENA